jgi:hypothetical protein
MMPTNNEIIESILLIFSVVPIYLFFRAFTYRIFIRFFWGEYNFYNDPASRQIMNMFVYTGLCPHPFLSDAEKLRWSKHWWLYGLMSFLLFFAIALLGYIA